jgi:hypothetical protein
MDRFSPEKIFKKFAPNNCFMSLTAVVITLKSRRFWVWQICGATIYAIPAIIRLATGEVVLPVLSWFATPWVDHYIPSNLVEKIIVNAFFPGAAGAVAGEIYFQNFLGSDLSRRQKYLARLSGAMLWVTVWSLFQFWGNMQGWVGSYGGNLFEYPMVYPLNYALAALSIFTPTVVAFLAAKLAGAFQRGGAR